MFPRIGDTSYSKRQADQTTMKELDIAIDTTQKPWKL